MVLSSDISYIVVSRVAVIEDLNLSSKQEEADTKIILHCIDDLHRNHGEIVFLWSPSGNTDLVVLAAGLLQGLVNDQVFMANGSSSNEQHYKLSEFEIDNESVSTVLGLHAFTGNDYESSFFRKGK